VVWRVCVLLAWVGAVVGLALLEPDSATLYVWLGPPLTVAVGALVDRWWALLTPVAATAGYLAVLAVQDPSCSSCGEDDYWTLAAIWSIIFTVPAVLALGTGIGARSLTRFVRGLDSEADAEHLPEPPRSPPRAPRAP
jgi:hypothetical protein